MNPILFKSTDTTFSTNGIGILSDAISCRSVLVLNGRYELELKYPTTGLHFSSIQQRSIILAKTDPVSELQPFRVYQITKTSSCMVTVRARHLAYDLGGVPVSPFTSQGVISTLNGLSANAAVDCPFAFITDKTDPESFSVKTPSLIWSLLGSAEGGILDTFGGEYEFDVYDVRLWSRRGADRGVSIRYGKNLTSLEQDENCANCYTGVYPYWNNAEGQLAQLPEKIVSAPGTFNYVKIKPVNFSAEWQEAPTEEQLRNRAEEYIANNDIGKPTVSWKIEFVQLEQTVEYKGTGLLERVLLGDTVSVEFAQMGVSASSRVVEVDYDTILERYNSVTLGSVKSNLASTIVEQGNKIDSVKTEVKSDIRKAKESATAWLTNGKGYAYFRKDGLGNIVDILFMDRQDAETAINVMRIGQSGIGFSHNGVNGPFESAWTIDGSFVADFITAGILNASLIKTGVFQSADGSFSVDMQNGKFIVNIPNADGTPHAQYSFSRNYGLQGAVYNPGSFGDSDYYPCFNIETGGTQEPVSISTGAGKDMFIGPAGVGYKLQIAYSGNPVSINSNDINIGDPFNAKSKITVNGKETSWQFSSELGKYVLCGE